MFPSFSAACVTVALVTHAVPSDAAAPLSDDERAQVLALYDDGKVLFNAGQYTAAIAAFEAGLELSGDPTFLFNIALALDRLGDLEGALKMMERYRESLPETDRPPIDQRIQGLRIRIAAKPEPEPEPEPEPAASPPPAPAPSLAECPDPVLPPAPVQIDDPRIITPPVVALLAGTGATMVAGGVLGGISLAATRHSSRSCSNVAGDLRCAESADDSLDRAQRTALAADVLFAVGGGLAVGTVATLIANSTKRKRAKPRVRASLTGQLHF